jgi:hypothetical protein
VAFNDIIVRRTGTTSISILAADADSNYILELEIGTTDKGVAITGEIESHDIRQRDMAYLFAVDIDANYADATMPVLTLTLTNHEGQENVYTRTPTGSGNKRLHHFGTRMNAAVSIRAKLEIESTKADEILSLELGYIAK